jgi:hypothetical protein
MLPLNVDVLLFSGTYICYRLFMDVHQLREVYLKRKRAGCYYAKNGMNQIK